MKVTNKVVDRPTKIRRITALCILLADIIFFPWIVKFPVFLLENRGKDMNLAPQKWLSYGPFKSFLDIFYQPIFRYFFIFLQLPILALIIAVLWNADKLKKRNKIHDGLGGPEPAGEGQHGTSRWQNKAEMDQTSNVWYPEEPISTGGTIFGMERAKNGEEKVWYNKEDLHELLIAATRSGKSRKIYLPTIWTLAHAGESMVIGDPKGELFITSKEYLEKMGYKVIALNIREPKKGNQWNLLELVNRAIDNGDIPKATEAAWDIANTICSQKPATSSEPIWQNGEESTIAALILLSCMDSDFKFQRHMTTAYYLLAEYGQAMEDGTIPLLEYLNQLPVRHPAKAAFATAKIAPYKTRSSFFTQALSDLRLFSDPNISDMTSKSDHDFEKVGIDKTAVFLIIPDEKSTRNVLATVYIDQLYQSLVDLANRCGGRIPRRVNMLLDEFGNLPAIPNFDQKLTVAGGRGIRFTLAVQDFAQIKKLYKDNSPTITGNCHIWVYLKTKDIETSKIISEQTGKYTVATSNSSSTVQNKGHSSTVGEGLTGRALLDPDEVRRWDIEESLVFPMSYFPARYPLPDLSFWRANEDYGFVSPSGDVEKDVKVNLKIIEQRWNNIPSRPIEEVSIWLPEIETDEPEEETPKTKTASQGPDSAKMKPVDEAYLARREAAPVSAPMDVPAGPPIQIIENHNKKPYSEALDLPGPTVSQPNPGNSFPTEYKETEPVDVENIIPPKKKGELSLDSILKASKDMLDKKDDKPEDPGDFLK